MDREPLRVLIAEDDELTAAVIRAELGAEGMSVVGLAPDGRRAVELVCSLRPDVVVMDVGMPEMNGLDATRAIQDRCPTPVVILTAHTGPIMAAEAADAGVGAYLVKPPDPGELGRAVAIARARFADLLELRKVNAELRDALARVKTLTGLLPICCHCKKIRDDHGYWSQLEEYLSRHSDADFTHGICPECRERYYGCVGRGQG